MESNPSASSTTFAEGQSTQRPPLFNGLHYNYWATRLRIYMQASGFSAWNATQKEFIAPTTEYSTWTVTQKDEANANAKAMNMLYCALDRNEFNRASICTSAHQIWEALKTIHEGTNKVKQTKISMLKNQFQNFKMRRLMKCIQGFKIFCMH